MARTWVIGAIISSPRWLIEDGAIMLSAADFGDIISQEKCHNLDLKLEWKISEGGNSGMFILADEEGKSIYTLVPDIQILDNVKAKYNKSTAIAGSLYDMVAMHQSALKTAGEWNQLIIKLNGKLLQVWQNNVITTYFKIGSSTWRDYNSRKETPMFQRNGEAFLMGAGNADNLIWI